MQELRKTFPSALRLSWLVWIHHHLLCMAIMFPWNSVLLPQVWLKVPSRLQVPRAAGEAGNLYHHISLENQAKNWRRKKNNLGWGNIGNSSCLDFSS